MIGYSLFYLQQAHCNHIVINTHHLGETVQQAVNNLMPNLDCEISYSDEQPIILDSAGGIKQASTKFRKNDPIVVLNGDSVSFV